MKKSIVKTSLAMALLAGCGGTGFRTVGANDSTDTTDVGTSTQTLQVDLRVKGAGTAGYSNLLLSPSQVQVWADGRRLSVEPVGDLINLADVGQSEKIATIAVPVDAKKIEFAVTFAPAGGFDSPSSSGWIDTRSKEIRFESTFENVAFQDKAVIEFDAAKSFTVRDATTLGFVPRYNIQY